MTFALASLPTWVAPYTTAPNGCLQWVYVTMKIKESRSNYLAFTAEIVSQLSPLQCANISYVVLIPSDVSKTNANCPSVRQRPWLSGTRDLHLR